MSSGWGVLLRGGSQCRLEDVSHIWCGVAKTSQQCYGDLISNANNLAFVLAHLGGQLKQMRFRVLSHEQVDHVIRLIRDGMSFREVARQTSVKRATVGRVARAFGVSSKYKTSPGRPRTLTSRDIHVLSRIVTSGKAHTAAEAARELSATTNVSISATTARRALKEAGMVAIVRKKKPLLTSRHRRLRLLFARKYMHYTVEDWLNVIWSDETKINMFGSDGRVWAWKWANRSDTTEREVIPTVKFGGGHLMLWGCISRKGVGGFCRIDGNMDSSLYCEILQGELKDTITMHDLDPETVIFQHDNDPKHKSKAATICLEEMRLRVLEWPPQSPDLNPIEHLWQHLKAQLNKYATPPSGYEELWARVQSVWLSTPPEVVQNLIESMPRRIAAVLKSKGGYTKY